MAQILQMKKDIIIRLLVFFVILYIRKTSNNFPLEASWRPSRLARPACMTNVRENGFPTVQNLMWQKVIYGQKSNPPSMMGSMATEAFMLHKSVS